MVSCRSVWIDLHPGGIDMHDGVRQVRDVMEKFVVGGLCDLVRSRDRQCAIHAEPDLREETVPHPSGTDLGHRQHPRDGRDGLGDTSDDGRIDGIEQTLTDAASSLVADDLDGGCDHQTHHGVGPLGPERHGDGTDEHSQRSDAVSACVDAVGLQRR
jgi:hypothetical protein